MKGLQTGWKKLTAAIVALLMALGMTACSKEPAEQETPDISGEQEIVQSGDQQQSDVPSADAGENADPGTDETPDADVNEDPENEDIWELPEQDFDDPANLPEDNETSEEEKPSDGQGDSNAGDYDGGVIVLPEDIWE